MNTLYKFFFFIIPPDELYNYKLNVIFANRFFLLREGVNHDEE